jgi:hypothetical protein
LLLILCELHDGKPSETSYDGRSAADSHGTVTRARWGSLDPGLSIRSATCGSTGLLRCRMGKCLSRDVVRSNLGHKCVPAQSRHPLNASFHTSQRWQTSDLRPREPQHSTSIP